MPRWAKRPDDAVLAELYMLADRTAVLPSTVAKCTTIIQLLPERLIKPDASALDKAAVLKRLMFEILDDAYASRQIDIGDVFAGMLLAAGAVMGLVTERPKEPVQRKPSEMIRKASSHNKEVRQTYAGEWLSQPVGWDQFRKPPKTGGPSKEHQSLETFREALLSTLGIVGGLKPGTSQPVGTSVALGLSHLNERLPGADEHDSEGNDESPTHGLATASPKESKPDLRRRQPVLIGGGIALVVLFASIAGPWVWSNIRGDNDESTLPTTTSGSSPTTVSTPESQTPGPAASGVSMTFDAIGGRPPIIQVYPGVTYSAQDKQQNGTFNDGEVVPALCKKKGRTVSSRPDLGDEPRTSDDWIRIVGTPGLTQYATAVFAKDPDALLAKLPNC
jgi:hypothetical protein